MSAFRWKKLLPFMQWLPNVGRRDLLADLLAGLTGAIIVLPQGVAYAFIAGLPPEYGLYTAIVTAIVAALFGSSWHMVSGPTAAISIVVMSLASAIAEVGTAHYIAIVLTITFLAGLLQLAMGLLNLGTLVNFISHTVVIGFTAGAAILIAGSQLEHVFGVASVSAGSFVADQQQLWQQIADTDLYAVSIALVTLVSALLIRRINRRWPHLLIGLLAGSLFGFAIGAADKGVAMVGALPGTLPPFQWPQFSSAEMKSLASGAFAVALLGLIEAVSIARAIALRSQQRINGNQEFIGQGLSNIVGSLFSCYAGSGSFTRSGANYDAGARTPLAAIFAALITAFILLLLPDITAYLPLPAMAGSILLIAWNLIDFHHIRQIMRSDRSETAVLLVTFASTLFIELEFAIYLGVLLSLAFYLRRTSRPTVMAVAPRQDRPRRELKNVKRFGLDQCPQIKILRIDGSIFFGAIDHVQQQLHEVSGEGKPIRHVLIIGKGINFIDVAGAEMFIQEANRLKARGGRLIISSLKGTVLDELARNGYLEKMGNELFYESPREAIATLITELDMEKCRSCEYRIFFDCPEFETDTFATDASTTEASAPDTPETNTPPPKP